ncbi:Acylpyruvase FAHD1, mitochondrial, partial [Smittium mucronatum]
MADFIRKGKKIVAIGKNYIDHAKEFNSSVPTTPMFFLKPTSSYVTEPHSIRLPPSTLTRDVHHEIELGIVIKSRASNVPADMAPAVIGGFVLALDLTARDLQQVAKTKGYPWTMAKGFDCFTP